MISREETIEILKDHWKVAEFTFLAKFDLAKKYRDSDDKRAFGFFNEIHFNKKILTLPQNDSNSKNKYASCYSLKGDLEHNNFYVITALLNDDFKREKSPFGLKLKNYRKATEEDIFLHKSDQVIERKKPLYSQKKGELFLGYVNFVADDKSHAFVKVIDSPNVQEIKGAYGGKGDILRDLPPDIHKDQIILISKVEGRRDVKFIDDKFHGYLCGSDTFIDLDSLNNFFILDNIRIAKGLDLDYFFPEYNTQEKLKAERCGIQLYYSRNTIYFEIINVDQELSISNLDTVAYSILEQFSSESELSDSLSNLLKLTSKFSSRFEEDLLMAFQKGLEKSNLALNKELISKYLVKWTKLSPGIVRLSNIGNLNNSEDLLELWIKREIPEDFFEKNFLDCLINFVIKKPSNLIEVFKAINQNQREYFKRKIEILFESDFAIETTNIFEIMGEILDEFSFDEDVSQHYKSNLEKNCSENLKYELWKKGSICDFPLGFAIKDFVNLNKNQQEKVIIQLDTKQLIPLIGDIKPTSKKQINERIDIIKNKLIVEQLNPVSFDIESDTKSISEIAWNNGDDWFSFEGNELKKGLNYFQETIDKENLLVGHNILNFDLPTLESLESIYYQKEKIWDTLEVEKILSPEFKTYALNTKHSAIDDAKHTYKLFENQLHRILAKDNITLKSLEGTFSEEIIIQLELLKESLKFSLNYQTLNSEKSTFYRPQPKVNSVITELDKLITNSLSKKKIILGASGMVSDILGYSKVVFADGYYNKIDFQIIDSSKVFYSIQIKESYKSQLLNYLDFCSSNNLIPYWGNVSPATRLSIEEEADVWTLFESKENKENNINPLFLTPGQLDIHFSKYTNSAEEIELIILQPDLISITQKEILKKFDSEELKALYQDNYFWLKFSGGQSVVSITRQDVNYLGIENLDKFDNFWIEKYQYGKYIIYANRNWEKLIETLNFEKISKVELNPNQFKTDQVACIKFSNNVNGQYNITRFNPESIYRSRYWVIQKKIIDQLIQKGDTVLLVQRQEEIRILSNYFRDQGYFIPKIEASLGRRLELLHSFPKVEKIIIANLNDADTILRNNHTDPINLIIDSFNLIDSYYSSQDTSFFNSKIKDGSIKKHNIITEKTTRITDNKKEAFLKDNFFLLKLLRPQITHLRNLLHLNNSENKLLLLDPRIEDFKELGKLWNVNKDFVYGWANKEEYEDSVIVAEKFITSPKPIDIPFTIEEGMEIIRKVFIPEHPWRPEQIPYIKNILGTNNDWLVTLPTGVGKSVLFQGPAIYKSAFTNRMTIVITPLKALMEDHTKKLWELGFYGNVEYLNSDRSTDTEFIYRSIAGGELSMIFVTPERFRSKGFINALETRIQSDGGMEYFVFDEAHCVSQWGHDFRPDYFNSAKHIWRTKITSEYQTPILLFSATVSDMIYDDFNTIFS